MIGSPYTCSKCKEKLLGLCYAIITQAGILKLYHRSCI